MGMKELTGIVELLDGLVGLFFRLVMNKSKPRRSLELLRENHSDAESSSI